MQRRALQCDGHARKNMFPWGVCRAARGRLTLCDKSVRFLLVFVEDSSLDPGLIRRYLRPPPFGATRAHGAAARRSAAEPGTETAIGDGETFSASLWHVLWPRDQWREIRRVDATRTAFVLPNFCSDHFTLLYTKWCGAPSCTQREASCMRKSEAEHEKVGKVVTVLQQGRALPNDSYGSQPTHRAQRPWGS